MWVLLFWYLIGGIPFRRYALEVVGLEVVLVPRHWVAMWVCCLQGGSRAPCLETPLYNLDHFLVAAAYVARLSLTFDPFAFCDVCGYLFRPATS